MSSIAHFSHLTILCLNVTISNSCQYDLVASDLPLSIDTIVYFHGMPEEVDPTRVFLGMHQGRTLLLSELDHEPLPVYADSRHAVFVESVI